MAFKLLPWRAADRWHLIVPPPRTWLCGDFAVRWTSSNKSVRWLRWADIRIIETMKVVTGCWGDWDDRTVRNNDEDCLGKWEKWTVDIVRIQSTWLWNWLYHACSMQHQMDDLCSTLNQWHGSMCTLWISDTGVCVHYVCIAQAHYKWELWNCVKYASLDLCYLLTTCIKRISCSVKWGSMDVYYYDTDSSDDSEEIR